MKSKEIHKHTAKGIRKAVIKKQLHHKLLYVYSEPYTIQLRVVVNKVCFMQGPCHHGDLHDEASRVHQCMSLFITTLNCANGVCPGAGRAAPGKRGKEAAEH
eukprot:6213059-Pleurochrysis_carterae.AAC.3